MIMVENPTKTGQRIPQKDRKSRTTMLHTIRFSNEELANKQAETSTIASIDSHIRQFGCVVLENAFPPVLIQDLHRTFTRKYKRYCTPGVDVPNDVLKVGDKRWMITVKVKGAFNQPAVYANPLLFPWLMQLLGEECYLSSFGCVVSHPGAKAQHRHRDLPELFEEPRCQAELPCYALTMLTPLIEANHEHGTTAIAPGSHLHLEEDLIESAYQKPTIPVGGCMLIDYRLHHGGTPNHAEHPRPLLFQVYSRPWFRDYRNFRKQPALWLTRSEKKQIPALYQPLFRHAHLTWW
jgi:ectoine hydroxylase-related dioxygenase (phytanoyl-CoA dioxygenase family)